MSYNRLKAKQGPDNHEQRLGWIRTAVMSIDADLAQRHDENLQFDDIHPLSFTSTEQIRAPNTDFSSLAGIAWFGSSYNHTTYNIQSTTICRWIRLAWGVVRLLRRLSRIHLLKNTLHALHVGRSGPLMLSWSWMRWDWICHCRNTEKLSASMRGHSLDLKRALAK